MEPDPILQAFARLAALRADRALVATPRRRFTVGDVDRASAALAEELDPRALPPGALVGLTAPQGAAFVVGYLALRRRGLVPVLTDAAMPGPERAAVLARLGASGALAASTGWPRRRDDWRLERRVTPTPVLLDPSTGAVKLTSGSSGLPRGVAVGSEALLADEAQLASSMGLVAEDRLLAAVPLSHSYGFASLLLPALVRGSLLIFPEEKTPFAPVIAAGELGATFFPTAPPWLNAIVRLAEPPRWPETLRLVISAGAPLLPETAARCRERFELPVHVFYGASESGGIAYDREGGAAERGSVGTPVDGVAVEIDGESGRVAVRSRAVATTYLPAAEPELGDGRFLTSDLGHFVAGELRLEGRADDLVLVKGKNVNPREIERVLRELPGVVDAAVVGIEGPDGPASVVRAVLVAEGGDLSYEHVVAHCRSRLAEYKVPRSVVVVDVLPRTERGKLDRAAIERL